MSTTSPQAAAIAPGWRAPARLAALGRLWPALLPALLFLPVVLAPPLNHDVAAVLEFSQRWLGGERLYIDLIDVNPPLIYVLNLVPAALAWATPLDGVAALRLCLLALGAAIWRLALLVRHREGEGAVERAFLDVLPALFLLDAGYDFGQREHLMAMAALPYLLAASRRARGERPRGGILAAAVAAVGFAIKPHFLAIPALVEAAVIAGRARPGIGAGLRRSLADPVPWAMAGLWALYLAALPLCFPEYLGSVVPLVWDYYLALGGLGAAEVLLLPRMATVLCLLVPLAGLALARRERATGLPGLLALAATGALIAALAQHKGWSYHILPIELFSLALGGVLAAQWLDSAGLDHARLDRAGLDHAGLDRAALGHVGVERAALERGAAIRVAAGLAGLFALYAVSNGEAPWKELGYPQGEAARLARLLREAGAAGERVLVLSPGIYPIYPALNDVGARNTLRTMNLWLLQGAYERCLPDGRRYREVWQMGRPEFFVYRTVAEDFSRAPPAAVVVDKQPGIPWCGEEFDFVAYFRRHPLFAELWSHYRLAAEWDRYRVYTRQD